MIRAIVLDELGDHPAKAIAAGIAAVLAVPVAWVLYVCWVEILSALGIPR